MGTSRENNWNKLGIKWEWRLNSHGKYWELIGNNVGISSYQDGIKLGIKQAKSMDKFGNVLGIELE